MLDFFKVKSDFDPDYLRMPYVRGRAGAQWRGTLVPMLELGDPSNEQAMSQMLAVYGSRVSGTKGDCAGFHLTWTAPKGVSIAALVSGDERLLGAHEEAVARTLDLLQRQVTSRVTSKGETRQVPTKHLAMLVNHRATSRSGDPGLHSLVVVLNRTDVGDGVLRAVDGRIFADSLMALGLAYRAELRNLVVDLGYEIEVAEAAEGEREFQVLWDLKDCSPGLCEAFSKRNKQIRATTEEATGKDFDQISYAGQGMFAKQTAMREKLPTGLSIQERREDWVREADALRLRLPGIPPARPASDSDYVPGPLRARRTKHAEKSAQDAIVAAHSSLCHPGLNGVSYADLVAVCMWQDPSVTSISAEQAIERLAQLQAMKVTDHPRIVYRAPKAARARRTGTVDASRATTPDAYIKVMVTGPDKLRAERYMLNRGHANFGAFLMAQFAARPSFPAAPQPASRPADSGKPPRRAMLKARVTPEVHQNIAAWAGGNVAESLRTLLCGGRRALSDRKREGDA